MTDEQLDGEVDRDFWREFLSSNPDWFDPEWDGDEECCICGGQPEPCSFDGFSVPSPDGPVTLRIPDEEPSCVDCRVDVAAKIRRRGVEQRGLEQYGE